MHAHALELNTKAREQTNKQAQTSQDSVLQFRQRYTTMHTTVCCTDCVRAARPCVHQLEQSCFWVDMYTYIHTKRQFCKKTILQLRQLLGSDRKDVCVWAQNIYKYGLYVYGLHINMV